MSSWAIITAPAHREAEARATLASLAHPPERTILVTSDACGCGPVTSFADDDPWGWLCCGGTEVNLAEWWNLGLTVAYQRGATSVAVLSAGVRGRPSSIPTLVTRMQDLGLVMVGPNRHGEVDLVMGEGHRRTTAERVDGGCFVLDAGAGLLADERFRWWYVDDDLECQARECGPVGIVAGSRVVVPPDGPPLFAVEGLEAFRSKWGREPW